MKLAPVEAREINPPAGAPAARWRLLTSHAVADAADARRIAGFYRQRWTIEQLFRALETGGFDVEALRAAEGRAFEKLVAASLIAAVTVLQLVHERDGLAKRPLEEDGAREPAAPCRYRKTARSDPGKLRASLPPDLPPTQGIRVAPSNRAGFSADC